MVLLAAFGDNAGPLHAHVGAGQMFGEQPDHVVVMTIHSSSMSFMSFANSPTVALPQPIAHLFFL
jgi:hypothetical protein